jgi:SAM-dependent methyltransferase
MVAKPKPDFPPSPAPSRRLEELTSCRLCGAAELKRAPAQPDPPFGLMQCQACGGICLSPRPPIEEMRHYYDEFYQGDREKDARQERRARRHFRRLARVTGKTGRLLEIGAGDGYFLDAARSAGWQVEGLELSAPRVEHAKRWFNLDLRAEDVLNAKLEPGSFDAVAMFQLIEHVHDPRKLLLRVNELLRPGGVLALSTPNVLAYARKKRDVNSWRIPRHLFFFTPRSLVRSAEAAGFSVLRRSLRFHATLEERLGWQPWPASGPLANITRDLWTPFGLHMLARKT